MSRKKEAEALKRLAKERGRKERFLTWRMWFATLNATLFPDRVTIPQDIGNNVFIGNNQLITKNNLSTYIIVKEYSTETPVAIFSKLLKYVKKRVPGISMDIVIKNNPLQLSQKDSGLESRQRQWENSIENPNVSDSAKKRAARLLYSYDIFKSREKIWKSVTMIAVRGKNGLQLKDAVNETVGFLGQYGIQTQVIKSNLYKTLNSMFMSSTKGNKARRDIRYTLQTKRTLAEVLPATQGSTDDRGVVLGVNMYNKDPYVWDCKARADAKNIAVYATSGAGKTFWVTHAMMDFFAQDFSVSIVDIKGNEFSSFINSVNGLDIPCRQDTLSYINTFKLDKEMAKENPMSYFKTRFDLSLRQLEIVADVKPELKAETTTLLTKFLESVYSQFGVLSTNVNTWYNSDKIKPLILAEEFRRFASRDVVEKYGTLVDFIQGRFNIYFDKSGPGSYRFTNEYSLDEVYTQRAVRYDFGMLDSANIEDAVGFKLSSLFMHVVNSEFSRNNKANGLWTLQVLEEAQFAEIISEGLIDLYAHEFSLKRSQNRVNMLLCNSVSSIKDNPKARPILDNTTVLVIGACAETTREFLIKEYSLEKYRDLLKRISEDPEYANMFFIKNNMSSKIQPTIIKAVVPESAAQGPIYKVVDIETTSSEEVSA